MLRQTLYTFGVLCLLLACFLMVSGHWALLPHALVAGVLLTAGVAWERWRYKPMLDGPPHPDWRDTGERFTDTETGHLIGVYSDASGSRHYVRVKQAAKM